MFFDFRILVKVILLLSVLFLEELNKCIVRHIFSCVDETFALKFYIALLSLKIFVKSLLNLNWRTLKVRIQVFHIWEAKFEIRFSLVVVLKGTLRTRNSKTFILVICLGSHHLWSESLVVLLIELWSKKFFNCLNCPYFNFASSQIFFIVLIFLNRFR